MGALLQQRVQASVAGGAPWLLLEYLTSGVNWQPRNPAEAPGQMARNSLAHVARGSEGAMFFQWRQSRRGAEKFHSAMLPHGGTGTRVWREVTELGAAVDALRSVRGTRTVVDVAMLWDWQSWWAQNLAWRPSEDHDPRERADAFHEVLYDRHLTVDFAHPEADLSAYPLVVVPALYLMTEAAGNNLREYVERGGTLVVPYFSGVVDEHDAVHEGACLGAPRHVLGLTVEEFSPLPADERVRLTGPEGCVLNGDVWTEFVVPRGAETVWTYAEGPAGPPGGPGGGRTGRTTRQLSRLPSFRWATRAAGGKVLLRPHRRTPLPVHVEGTTDDEVPSQTHHQGPAAAARGRARPHRPAGPDRLGREHRKPVFVAETAYPFTLAQDDLLENQIDTSGELVSGYRRPWPARPSG